MAWEEAIVKVSRPAGADLSNTATYLYTGVKLNASSEVVSISSLTDTPYGVLQNDPKQGEAAAIAISGICKVRAGATIAAGDVIAFNTAGKAIVGATGAKSIGTAVTGGANGEVISVNISAAAPAPKA